jgi:hypothetical protein
MTPEEFNRLYPSLLNWISQTLAAHQSAARSVASAGFRRLPDFFSNNLLATAKVVAIDILPIPPLAEMGLSQFAPFLGPDIVGITYLDTFFVREDHRRNEELHFHELVLADSSSHAITRGPSSSKGVDSPLSVAGGCCCTPSVFFSNRKAPRPSQIISSILRDILCRMIRFLVKPCSMYSSGLSAIKIHRHSSTRQATRRGSVSSAIFFNCLSSNISIVSSIRLEQSSGLALSPLAPDPWQHRTTENRHGQDHGARAAGPIDTTVCASEQRRRARSRRHLSGERVIVASLMDVSWMQAK